VTEPEPEQNRRPRRARRPVSINDVAHAAGVSATTVSHVLSGKRPVNQATAARVRQVVNRMGYVPASLARSLQAGSTSVIGLLIPDITNGFYAELTKGVEDAAHDIGYSVILCNTEFDPAREDHYLDLIRGRFIDAMVYAAGTPPTEARLESLLGRFPIAVVDEVVTGLTQTLSAMADHYQGGTLVGEHLRGLGHRRALVLTGPVGLPSADERSRGFRDAFQGDVIQLEGTWLEQSGADEMRGHLASGPFDRTAVFAANDQMALGVLAVLNERGIGVPGEVSLVGFDDIRAASLCAPPLTTVHQPAYDIGRTATTQLLQYVANGEVPPASRHLLPVHLEVRGSTARARG
jgi:LacI family transcriptional regulator